MKLCLAVLAALVVAMSATVHDLIRHEVQFLYNSDSDMSIDHCTTKCDALFDLIAGHDEDRTDKMCHYECACLAAAPRSAENLLSQFQALPRAPWPDGGPESLKSPSCELATYKSLAPAF
ncbi:hypothetical protein k02a2.6-like [Plakobranchus ocellatus]|uniref:Uncharacterized protein n=1 Tax=Plakobranchus ocellatus TaxID=259542 RepID=A0AAV3Y1A6_9GAST|nr:hypothetical protein k02a2.6-like [Plakobranchus ocellatus]